MVLWLPISYGSWVLKLDQKNITDHYSRLKSDQSANRAIKFAHTFILSESLVSNGENRRSLSLFVLELLRKQSHARTFWMGHLQKRSNNGVIKYPGGENSVSKSSPRPSAERSYRVQMRKEETNFLLYIYG